MKRVVFLLISIICFGYTGESGKIIRIFSEDSSLVIESKFKNSGGTQHGVDTVSLIGFEPELDDTIYTVKTAKNFPLFPLFKKIITIQREEVGKRAALYLALGWSSGGSGHESFTGWLIRKDYQSIDCIDRFRLTKLRSYPDIMIDTANNRVAVVRMASQLSYEKEFIEESERDSFLFMLSFASGTEINLLAKKGTSASKQDRFDSWIKRPYKSGKPEFDEIVQIIDITPSGFDVKDR